MMYRDLSGEMRLPNRWSRCVICGGPTAQPPVCYDGVCEIAFDKMEDSR